MKNKSGIIGIILLVAIIGILIYFFFFRGNTTSKQSEYTPSRIATNTTVSNNGNQNQNTSTQNNLTNNTNTVNEKETKKKTKTKVSSFSTPIVDDNKNRINNIKITCSRISDTTVKAHEEFSFCDVVGQPSSDDGYKEAHAFVDGELVNAIGGGNCQVSTTIYNAAKAIDGVEITERHEHEKEVGYIEKGKDATVAYDYLDLKFENHNDYDLQLDAYIKNDKVCVDIYKVV